MSLGQHVFLYCERGTASFWAEPANALTNLGFIVAAAATWRALRSDEDVPTSVGFMPPLMLLIGLGSFAFHTLATGWAQILDVAPIAVFVIWYLASFLRWFYGLTWRRCLLGVAGFLCLEAAFAGLAGRIVPNRSAVYVPVLVLMLGLAAALRMSRDTDRAGYWPAFGAASVVFAAALLARTVDRAVCGDVPLGTHFLWHLLTASLVLLVSRPLIRRWRSVEAREGAGVPRSGERVVRAPARGDRLGPGRDPAAGAPT